MPDLTQLLSQRPMLIELARYVSTVDLLNLALTNSEHHAFILGSKAAFDVLRRECLCDGHGLTARKGFSIAPREYVWGKDRRIWKDEPIEVRLFNIECEVEALPCRKCGINICEECRKYPREPSRAGYPERRPHLNSPFQLENVMCLCDPCDAAVEATLKGKFLNELCDCDIFTRWICRKCVKAELEFTWDYYKKHTKGEWESEDYEAECERTKTMGDHQHSRHIYCICGANVPDRARPRCTWCKRRHLPESQWYEEWKTIGCKQPFFDEDPCYPPYIGDIYNFRADSPYPELKYKGPIWQASQTGISRR